MERQDRSALARWAEQPWRDVPGAALHFGHHGAGVCAIKPPPVGPTAGGVDGEETGMTYVIAEQCVDVIDQSCVAVCPVDCIHFESGVDRKLFIDPDECIDCGACEPECPVNAIYPEDSLPAEYAKYTQVDAVWFKDRAAARAMIDEWKPL